MDKLLVPVWLRAIVNLQATGKHAAKLQVTCKAHAQRHVAHGKLPEDIGQNGSHFRLLTVMARGLIVGRLV